MNPLRELQNLTEFLLIVIAVWTAIIGGGIGLFWLIGKVLGA